MTFGRTVLLGAIAGSTIFLGLPIGRLKDPRPRLKALLNAVSAGILIFLFFDILENATAPLDDLAQSGGGVRFAGLLIIYVMGFAAGLLSLLYVGKYQRSRRASPAIGPGAMAVVEAREDGNRRAALQLGVSIAVGIGLHNFSEGLAIGQAAHVGEAQLAVLLVVGFALHNATEGFGIVGPLAAASVRASWSYLITVGLIAGAPTFLGTIVGNSVSNEYLFVAFLTLAAGAILYVVFELLNTGKRLGAWDVTVWGVLIGFLLGLGTDLVIFAAHA